MKGFQNVKLYLGPFLIIIAMKMRPKNMEMEIALTLYGLIFTIISNIRAKIPILMLKRQKFVNRMSNSITTCGDFTFVNQKLHINAMIWD